MKIFGYDIQMKRAAPTPKLDSGTVNQVYRALYQFLGDKMPVWMPDNLESYIRKGFSYNSDVYSIVNYIITTASMVPWELMRKRSDGTLKRVESNDSDAKELLKVVDEPNPHQGQSSFIVAMLGYKFIIGNTYIYKVTADKGIRANQALQLHVMPAHLVQILGGSITEPVGGYRIKTLPSDDIPAEKVFHSKYWNPDIQGTGGDDLIGLSPIKAAARFITGSNDAFTATASTFQNSGATGIITPKPNIQDTETVITKEQWNLAKRTWAKNETGASQYNKIAFLSSPIDYHQLGMSPVDMALLGAMELSFEQLGGIWKFPSELLRSKNSTYNTRDAAKKSLYEDVIMPELITIAKDMRKWLVIPFGEDLVYQPDFSGIEVLQKNKKDQTDWLEKAWWLTPNERREQMDYPKSDLPEMERIYVPTTLMPIEDLAMPAPQQTTDITQPIKELELLGIREYERSNGNGKH